jgi:hypothetical protein
MKVVGSSKRQGLAYWTTWYHIQVHCNLYTNNHENIKFYKPHNIFCGQDAQYFNIKVDGMYKNHYALKA